MRTCPKCKTPTAGAPGRDRADMPEVVPPSRCTHCQACGCLTRRVEQHLSRLGRPRSTPRPAADGLAGFCPRCNGLLVPRAPSRPAAVPSRPVPGLRRRMVSTPGEWGGSRQQRVADAPRRPLGPGVAPPWCASAGAHARISRRSERALGPETLNASGPAVPPPESSHALSRPFLPDRGACGSPPLSLSVPRQCVRPQTGRRHVVRDGGEGQMDRIARVVGLCSALLPAPR